MNDTPAPNPVPIVAEELPRIHIAQRDWTNADFNLQPFRPADTHELEHLIAYTIDRIRKGVDATATLLVPGEVFNKYVGKAPSAHALDELGGIDSMRVLIRGSVTHMHNHFPDRKYRHAMTGRHKAAFAIVDHHLALQKQWGPQLNETQTAQAMTECLNLLCALHMCMTLQPKERDQMLARYMRGGKLYDGGGFIRAVLPTKH